MYLDFFYYNNKFLQSQYIAPINYLRKNIYQSRIKNVSSMEESLHKKFFNQGTFRSL